MELHLVNERRHENYAAQRLAEFAARCRAGGLAVTPQRLAIIKELLESSEHPRADAIFAAVREQHPHISLATVHRTLETLCDIGEARKVTTLHDSARYDGNITPHHHVVCVKCRRIRDIEIPELDRMLTGRSELGEFTLLGSALEVQALCESCSAKDRKPSHETKTKPRTSRKHPPRPGVRRGSIEK
jgi:Fur family peroxide stress response transcriptional regulator